MRWDRRTVTGKNKAMQVEVKPVTNVRYDLGQKRSFGYSSDQTDISSIPIVQPELNSTTVPCITRRQDICLE